VCIVEQLGSSSTLTFDHRIAQHVRYTVRDVIFLCFVAMLVLRSDVDKV